MILVTALQSPQLALAAGQMVVIMFGPKALFHAPVVAQG